MGLLRPDVPVNAWALSSSAGQSFPELTSVHVNSTDELMLASGYSSTISLYDLATGHPYRSFDQVHSKHINIVRFANSTPHLMASCSFDKFVKLWDLRVPGCTPVFTLPSNGPTVMIAFSPNDLNLLVSGVDNDVTQFDVTSGRLSLDLPAPRTGLDTAYTRSYYGNAGDTIVTANSQENVLRYHSAVTGDELDVVNMQQPSDSCTQYVQSLRGSPHTPWEAAVLVTSRLPGAGMQLKMVQWDASGDECVLPPGCYARQGHRLLDALATSNGGAPSYVDEEGQVLATEPPGQHMTIPAAYSRPLDWPDFTAALRDASIAVRNEAYEALKTHFTPQHLQPQAAEAQPGTHMPLASDTALSSNAAGNVPAAAAVPPPPPLLAASSSCLSQPDTAHTSGELQTPPLIQPDELQADVMSASTFLQHTSAGVVCVQLAPDVRLHARLGHTPIRQQALQFDCQVGLQGSQGLHNAHMAVLRSRWAALQSADATAVLQRLYSDTCAVQLSAAPVLLLAPTAVGPPAALAMLLVHTYSNQLILTRVASANAQAALGGEAVSFGCAAPLRTADAFRVAKPPCLHRWQRPVQEARITSSHTPLLAEVEALSALVLQHLHSPAGRDALGVGEHTAAHTADALATDAVFTPGSCSSMDLAALCSKEAAQELAALGLPAAAAVPGPLPGRGGATPYPFLVAAASEVDEDDDVQLTSKPQVVDAAEEHACMPRRTAASGGGESFALRLVRLRALLASAACMLRAAERLGCTHLAVLCEERLIEEVEPCSAPYLALLAEALRLQRLRAACAQSMLQCPASHSWGSDAMAEAAAIEEHLPLLATLLARSSEACSTDAAGSAGAGADSTSSSKDAPSMIRAVAQVHCAVSDAYVGAHFPSARDVRCDVNRLFSEEWDPLVEDEGEQYTPQQLAAAQTDVLTHTPFKRHPALLSPVAGMQLPPGPQLPPVPRSVAAAIASKARTTSHDGISPAYGMSSILIAPGKLLLLGGMLETGMPVALNQGLVYDVCSKQMMAVRLGGDLPPVCPNATVVPLAIAPDSPHLAGGYASLLGVSPSVAGMPPQLAGLSAATDASKWAAADARLDFNGSGSALGHRFAVLLSGQHPADTDVRVLDTVTMSWSAVPASNPRRRVPTGRYLGTATLLSTSQRVNWGAIPEHVSSNTVTSRVLLTGGVYGRWDRPAPHAVLSIASQLQRDGSATHSLDWIEPFFLGAAAQLRVEHSCTLVPMGPGQAARAVMFGGSAGGAFTDTATAIRIPEAPSDPWQSDQVELVGLPPSARGLHSAVLVAPDCLVVACGAQNVDAGKPCNDMYSIRFIELEAGLGRPRRLRGFCTQLCLLGESFSEAAPGAEAPDCALWQETMLLGNSSKDVHTGAMLGHAGGVRSSSANRNVALCPRVRVSVAAVSPLVLQTPGWWEAYAETLGEDMASIMEASSHEAFPMKADGLQAPSFCDAMQLQHGALAAARAVAARGPQPGSALTPAEAEQPSSVDMLQRSPVLLLAGGALHIPTHQGQLMADPGVYSVRLVARSRLTRTIASAMFAARQSSDAQIGAGIVRGTAAELCRRVHAPPAAGGGSGSSTHITLANLLEPHMDKAQLDLEREAVRVAPFQHAVVTAVEPLVPTAHCTIALSVGDNPSSFGKALQRQQEWEQGHDIVLVSDDGGRSTSCGWLLQRSCTHFQTLIGNRAFSAAQSNEINVPFSHTCTQHLLVFVHTGQFPHMLQDDPHAVLELLQAAASISMDALVHLCESLLIAFLDVDNCLGLLQAASDHHCIRLRAGALAVALKDFQRLRASADWQELPPELAHQLEEEFTKTNHVHSVDKLVQKVTSTGAAS